MRRSEDPFGVYRFRLELGALQVAGFMECTGLQLEVKLFEYREGGRNSNSLKFPEQGEVGNISLKRGVTTGPGADALFKWQQDVANGTFDPEANPNLRPSDPNQDIDNKVEIVLLDEAGEEVKRWRLFRPFPIKWTGPELKATESESAIESLELAHEGLEQA